MLASHRWIVGCTLLVVFLGSRLVCAKSTEAQQIPIPKRDNRMVQTSGAHRVEPFYYGKKSHGLTDFVPNPAENNLFDIFCSAVDTNWFRPGQSISTPTLQRFRGVSSIPAMPTRRRDQLRPC